MPGMLNMDTELVERARVVAASTVDSLDGQVRTVDSEVSAVVGSPAWQMGQAVAYGGVNGDFCSTANVLNRALEKISVDTGASVQDYLATQDAGQTTVLATQVTPFGGALR
ncbi:hypothetical protein [Tenggerimyces flavus]|uniref:Excreted virulence factor EspC (Type VII ESX diderm) n=1 Tax=Tenggerimyces flavus TaxID=1708749 RepID=A0ABV7YL32_9ACTN|nr:hypothetical protein [Tenggerimyces flavus]MBM7790173.1 hypothetical protein [Tenggerimyces flavus]